MDITAKSVFKLLCLGILIALLIFLVTKLMIMGDTIDIMVNTNKTFI